MGDNQDILGKINADASTPSSTPQPAPAAAPAESGWARAFDGAAPPSTLAPGQVQNAQQVATAGSQMLNAAKSGQFTVEPGYAQQLIKTLGDEVDRLRGLRSDIQLIQQTAKLGETPAAQKVAPFYTEQVADGGPHSFVPKHEMVIAGLVNMADAIQIAMNNYRATDDGSASHIASAD